MAYRYAFFDLDGTVIDSSPGIFNSIRYTANKMGLVPPSNEQMRSFIGPPVVKSFARHYNLPEELAVTTIHIYREYYSVTGVLECELYDGIRTLIDELNAKGVKCVLATCKPQIYAEQILAHLGIRESFAFVSGPELDGTRGEKHEVINHAIEHLEIADRSEILMIGDRNNDMLGAGRAEVDAAGVLWGFGDTEELQSTGAKYLCKTPSELLKYF